MAAFAVAMSAKMGQLTIHAVDDMRARAEELLDRTDPVRSDILNFATLYELHARDKAALELLGENLRRAIDYATAPAPRVGFRSDIDG